MKLFNLIAYTFLFIVNLDAQDVTIDELTINFEANDDYEFIEIYWNDIDDEGTFGVNNGKFEIRDIEGTQCTPPFSISNGFNDNNGILLSGVSTSYYSNVSVTLAMSRSNAIFESCLNPGQLNPFGCTDFSPEGPGGDAVLVDIRLNNQSVITAGYCGANREGSFNTTGLSTSPGDLLQVFITGGTQSLDEAYFIDSIVVRGTLEQPPLPMVPIPVLETEGDIYTSTENKGIIMKNDEGECYRLKLDNDGNAITEVVICPDN